MYDHESDETSYQPTTTKKYLKTPILHWTSPTGPREFAVQTRVVVGSSSNCGLVLDDRAVSRVHAELDPKEEGVWIRDLGSKNGTFCNGMRITGVLIPPHAALRIGSVELRVEYDKSPTPVEIWPQPFYGGLVGGSVAMRRMFSAIDKVAHATAPVFIHGETGTGKELVARAIHEHSQRPSGPFVVVDCGALSESLLDAELFGHTKGAFTGATSDRMGAFQAADGGTIFLDEIGEIPLQMQPKLLRVLEAKTVRRLGETAQRSVDVRFISATHRDLLSMVTLGHFREDLYFRLSVLPVEVPALRSRPEDLPQLLAHFARTAGEALELSAEVEQQLAGYGWSGNVRELRNFVDRATVLGVERALEFLGLRGPTVPAPESSAIDATMPPSVRSIAPFPQEMPRPALHALPFKEFRDRMIEQGERAYLRDLLQRTSRNVEAAVKIAELDKSYLYKLLRRHGL